MERTRVCLSPSIPNNSESPDFIRETGLVIKILQSLLLMIASFKRVNEGCHPFPVSRQVALPEKLTNVLTQVFMSGHSLPSNGFQHSRQESLADDAFELPQFGNKDFHDDNRHDGSKMG